MRIRQDQVDRLMAKWMPRLGLERWRISVVIHRRPEDEADEDSSVNAGYITVQDGYAQADLTLNAFQIESGDLEEVVVHELLHCVLWRLSAAARAGLGAGGEVADAISEEVIETITRALLRR